MIRMPHLTWRQRLAVGAGCLVFAAVGGTELPSASATNAGTSVGSACVDGHWIVTMAVTSQYDGVIHVVLEDPHSPLTHTLEPFATFSVSEHPDAGSKSWTWRWSSPDGHLTGDAVSGTLARPADCDVIPSTTLAPTTTAPPAPATTAPPAATSIVPVDSTVATPATVPATAAVAPSTTVRLFLPTTGSSSNVVVVAGLGALLVGALLLLARRGGHA